MNRTWWTWLIVIAGAVAAWSMATTLGGVDLREVGVGKVTNVLVALMFVALLIERAVEVFISPSTGLEKEQLKSEQARLRTAAALLGVQIDATRKASLAAPQDGAVSQQMAGLEAQLAANLSEAVRLEAGIAEENRRIQRIALAISIPLSFLAALAGLRTLATFLPEIWTDAQGAIVAAGTVGAVRQGLALNEAQLQLFTAVDVVLTAGLLAGGADGIHQILDRFIKLAAGRDGQQPVPPAR